MHLTFGGAKISVYHGSPWDPQEQYIYPDFREWERFASVDADIIVMGHTHRPLHEKVAGKCIINPGSCGQPRDGIPGAPYAIVDTESREVVMARAEYDADAAERDAAAVGLSYRKR